MVNSILSHNNSIDHKYNVEYVCKVHMKGYLKKGFFFHIKIDYTQKNKSMNIYNLSLHNVIICIIKYLSMRKQSHFFKKSSSLYKKDIYM